MVPELSPRLTNGAAFAAIFCIASTPLVALATPAGSLGAPRTTKSLYMTSWRSMPCPAAIQVFSAGGAWTRTTSASPRSPSARACPVPTEIVLTR